MRTEQVAVIAIAAIAWLAGCDSKALPAGDERADGGYAMRLNARYQVDIARERTWWLTGEGVSVHEGRHPRKVELPLPGWFVAGAAHGCPPALALGPKGEAVITSNVIPTLWRVDPETRAVSVHRLVLDADNEKDVGFSGLVYSPEHAAFFAVSDGHGSLWRIDASLTRGEKIGSAVPAQAARDDRAAAAVRSRCLRAGRLLHQFAQSL